MRVTRPAILRAATADVAQLVETCAQRCRALPPSAFRRADLDLMCSDVYLLLRGSSSPGQIWDVYPVPVFALCRLIILAAFISSEQGDD